MCLKRLITVPFESSEPFHLLRMMGLLVSAHTYIAVSICIYLPSEFEETTDGLDMTS